MANLKGDFWHGWNKEAAAHFNVAPSAISTWLLLKNDTFDGLIKHRRLMDWIEEKLISDYGSTPEEAKDKVNEYRKGNQKCLEK